MILVIYLIYLIYPFYQRYWASCVDQVGGGCKPGKRFVSNLETIAYGLTFDDAETLANELRKSPLERKAPNILNPAQYGPM